jgi:hypothetical protein
MSLATSSGVTCASTVMGGEREKMSDASAVGLLLADGRGQLRFMAASDERARILEIFQVQASEGPCYDAFRSGQPVLNADLRDAVERWPDFTRHALEAGFRSVHAFSMRVRREVAQAPIVAPARAQRVLGTLLCPDGSR